MSEIILYTTDCPKCKVLEQKLKLKNISVTKNYSLEDMISLGFKQAPMLKVDSEFMDFSQAIAWVNNQ